MGGRGAMPLPIFFLPNNSFLLATELKRGKQEMVSKGEVMYVCEGPGQTNLLSLCNLTLS